MVYSFDSRIAEIYGVDEAVFLHNLYWWIAKNEANGRHHRDGRTWTYNSTKAFVKLFPFWNESQIRRIIDKLHKNGAIHIGVFNEKGFDRTRWYSLDETVTRVYENDTCIWQKQQMEVTETANGCDENSTPIPDSKPDSKPDIYEAAPPITRESLISRYGDELVSAYLAKAKRYHKAGDEAIATIAQWLAVDQAEGKIRPQKRETSLDLAGYDEMVKGYIPVYKQGGG